jgi:hypothetical protein
MNLHLRASASETSNGSKRKLKEKVNDRCCECSKGDDGDGGGNGVAPLAVVISADPRARPEKRRWQGLMSRALCIPCGLPPIPRVGSKTRWHITGIC